APPALPPAETVSARAPAGRVPAAATRRRGQGGVELGGGAGGPGRQVPSEGRPSRGGLVSVHAMGPPMAARPARNAVQSGERLLLQLHRRPRGRIRPRLRPYPLDRSGDQWVSPGRGEREARAPGDDRGGAAREPGPWG